LAELGDESLAAFLGRAEVGGDDAEQVGEHRRGALPELSESVARLSGEEAEVDPGFDIESAPNEREGKVARRVLVSKPGELTLERFECELTVAESKLHEVVGHGGELEVRVDVSDDSTEIPSRIGVARQSLLLELGPEDGDTTDDGFGTVPGESHGKSSAGIGDLELVKSLGQKLSSHRVSSTFGSSPGLLGTPHECSDPGTSLGKLFRCRLV